MHSGILVAAQNVFKLIDEALHSCLELHEGSETGGALVLHVVGHSRGAGIGLLVALMLYGGSTATVCRGRTIVP